MFASRRLEVLETDALFIETVFFDVPSIHQDRWLSLQTVSQPTAASNLAVEAEQDSRSHQAPDETHVGTDHRVLYDIGDQQERQEIERTHRAQQAPPAEVEHGQNYHVHDRDANRREDDSPDVAFGQSKIRDELLEHFRLPSWRTGAVRLEGHVRPEPTNDGVARAGVLWIDHELKGRLQTQPGKDLR